MRKKQKLLLGLASLTLFDLAVTTAPATAQVTSNWSGFYVGAHAGYRWADGSFTSPASFDFAEFPARNERYSLGGGIFGFHAGYNYLLSSSWLVGIEGDFTPGWGSSRRSATFDVFDVNSDGFIAFSRSSTLRLTWQATLRGRLGYINGPWLFYGTGGVAFTRAKWTDTASTELGDAAAWSAGKTLTGGVVGVGVEYMFDLRWIARVEYLYENFGSFNAPHGFGPQTGKIEIGDVQKVRFGISYKLAP